MRGPSHSPDHKSGGTASRAVSPVIGAVLLLAIAMLLVSILQTTAIPALNSQEEFRHNQDVHTDMVRLESTVDRVAAVGTGETAPVDVGYRYPPRLLFINPPPVSGSLRTTEQRPVTISNARAQGETGHFWTGDSRTYNTTSLVYDPGYNEYDGAPETVYEPWAVYNRQDGATVPLTDTDLVDGRRVSLVALDGELSRASPDAASVNVAPNSAPVETITVRNDTAPITVTVPTDLRRDTWLDLLEDELDEPGVEDDAYVTNVSCTRAPPEPCGELTLTLEPGSYELALGEVALGGDGSREGPAYLTDVDGDLSSVSEGGRQRLVVEARDRYDNTVSGVPVTASVASGSGTLRESTAETDADGQATFVYEAPGSVDTAESVNVTARIGDGREQTVTFDVRVVPAGGTDTQQNNGTTDSSASAVTTVTGSVTTQNIGGSDRGREAAFALEASKPVTITGFSVTTQNDLESRPFVDRDTTFDGGTLPVTFEGEIGIALRDIDASTDLPVSEFVDPNSPDADIVVTLEFDDGSQRTIGLG